MRAARAFVLAVALFAAGSWAAPWPVVPVLAALLALAAPRRFTPAGLACAAALAWAGILGWTARVAPVGVLARELVGIYRAPAWLLVLCTPLVAALLAWAGAAIAAVIVGRSPRRVPDD